jgi:hypothetical protein
MARRRTRAEKIVAGTRESYQYKAPKITESKRDYYVSEIPLALKLISMDLTKSLAVAILALILQFMLAMYLSRGGWQFVSSLLQKVTSGY